MFALQPCCSSVKVMLQQILCNADPRSGFCPLLYMWCACLLLLQDCAGIVEKRELADKVKLAAAQGPQGQDAAVPAGYAYDPSSGAHAYIPAHHFANHEQCLAYSCSTRVGISCVLTEFGHQLRQALLGM